MHVCQLVGIGLTTWFATRVLAFGIGGLNGDRVGFLFVFLGVASYSPESVIE